jgi:hypothetical protein
VLRGLFDQCSDLVRVGSIAPCNPPLQPARHWPARPQPLARRAREYAQCSRSTASLSNRRESISRPRPGATVEPDPANRPNEPRFPESEVVSQVSPRTCPRLIRWFRSRAG